MTVYTTEKTFPNNRTGGGSRGIAVSGPGSVTVSVIRSDASEVIDGVYTEGVHVLTCNRFPIKVTPTGTVDYEVA